MSNKTVSAMVDIETLDTKPTAIVFQVAVVLFDDETCRPIASMEWNLDIDDQMKAGRTMSVDTIKFHLGCDANHSYVNASKYTTKDKFITEFCAMFADEEITHWWSKGDFDFKVLNNMMFQPPWEFWQVRELRTLMSECGVSKGDVAHSALKDCMAQLEQLKQCRARINREQE